MHLASPSAIVFVAMCPVPPFLARLAAPLLLALSLGPHAVMAADPLATPVLVYHRFHADTAASMTVTVPVFERQLRWLADHGHPVVPLRDVVDSLRGEAPWIAPGSVAITADDGHRTVYTLMFPVIRRLGIPVTLFIYPSAISNASYALTWEELAEMQASGLVDVQSHTYWHPDFRGERASRSAEDYEAFAARQFTASRQRLQSRLGRPVDLLAWPWGFSDEILRRAAQGAGYRAAFALGEQALRPKDDPFALPRFLISDHDRGDGLTRIVGAAGDGG